MAKKAIKKSLKEKLNAGYEKMQAARMKEREGKAKKSECECGR